MRTSLRPRSEADAAGGVALRQRVDDDHEVLGVVERERADRLAAVVDELAIDLVADEEEAVVAAESGDRVERRARVDGAGRVARIAEDDDARARRQRFFEDVPRREVKAVTAAAEDGDEGGSRPRGEGGV